MNDYLLSQNNRIAALALVLLLALTYCRDTPQSCRCGVDAKERLLYMGPTADDGFPYPRIVDISRELDMKVFRISVSVPREKSIAHMILKTLDQGVTWIADLTYQKPQWQQSPSDPRVIYRGANGIYLRSIDRGQNWVEPRFVIDGYTKDDFVRQFSKRPNSRLSTALAAIHPRNPNTLYATFYIRVYSLVGREDHVDRYIAAPGMYISQDGGDHWTLFSRTVGNVQKKSESPPRLGISPSNPDVMIAHAEKGLVRSQDGGKTWTPVGQQAELERPAEQKGRAEAIAELRRRGDTTPIPEVAPVAKFQIFQIEFQPNDARVVYLVTNKGLYKSENGGDSWCLFVFGVPKLESIWSLAFDPDNQRKIFVGTESTVMVSSDGGCSFRTFFDYEQLAAKAGR